LFENVSQFVTALLYRHFALSNSDFLAARFLFVTLAHTPGFTCCLSLPATVALGITAKHFVVVSKHVTLVDEVVESACEDVPPMILPGNRSSFEEQVEPLYSARCLG
jgi:hypothetical protein